MNKGYAFGFLIILLVAGLGLYVAYTGFQAARDTLRAQATAVPTEQVGLATRVPTRVRVTLTPTLAPVLTATLAITPTVPPTAEPAGEPTAVPVVEPTEAPQPTEAPLPTRPPQPPPTPQPAFQFRVVAARPDAARGGCCYIFGTVRDAGGNPLEGVRVQISNQWSTPVVASTKGGADLGKYDFPIGTDKVTWYVSIVDAGGNRISSEAVVQFDVTVAGQYMVDWQRTY